jgi:uncharacterized protein
MAEQIVSPGVFTRENDQSFITQQPVEVGGALVGPTVLGPVEIPTIVTSYSQYQNKFGSTFVSGGRVYSHLTAISAYNYFQNGGNTLLVTRVVTGSFTPATASIANGTVVGDLSTVNSLSSSLSGNGNNYDAGTLTAITASSTDGSGVGATFNFTFAGGAGVSGVTAATAAAGGSGFVIGDTITFDAAELNDAIGSGTGTGNLVLTLVAADIADNPPSTAAFKLKTISEGTIMNSNGTLGSQGQLSNGTDDNVRWEISFADTGSGTFNLLIRQGNDLTNDKIVLETYAGISLDPFQDNYIAKVIGDSSQKLLSDSDGNKYLQVSGSYPNKSNYVYVDEVLSPTPNFFNNVGSPASDLFKESIPVVASGSFGTATGELTGSEQALFNELIDTNTQGLRAEDYSDAFSLLTNNDEYQYNVITAPGLIHGVSAHTGILNTLIANTQNRGDAIAVVDLTKYGSTITSTTGQAASINSSYAASYWPWCQIINPNTGKTNWVPASTLIPGVYAFNDNASEPWFAPAGINRGGLSQVIRPERKLQRSQRDTLYEKNVNPIANFPNTGTVVFGQKTLQKKASALDRVNVRRLLIALKSYIGQVANNLVFEQNTIATRNNFLAQVNPYMESVQQRQGVYAFKVVMDASNNTPDVIDRNQMVGQIFLQPTRTAEFIILDFNVLPTGAEFPA